MYKNQKGQENKHLTAYELVEFITDKKYKPGMLENSASIIFHLTNCKECFKRHEHLMNLVELYGKDVVIRDFKNKETDEPTPGI